VIHDIIPSISNRTYATQTCTALYINGGDAGSNAEHDAYMAYHLQQGLKKDGLYHGPPCLLAWKTDPLSVLPMAIL